MLQAKAASKAEREAHVREIGCVAPILLDSLILTQHVPHLPLNSARIHPLVSYLHPQLPRLSEFLKVSFHLFKRFNSSHLVFYAKLQVEA